MNYEFGLKISLTKQFNPITVGENMKIQTKYHGEITIEETQIVHFENGLPGFFEENEFVILPLTEEQVYFILQSVNTPELAFVITNPFLFYKDYEFKLEDGVIEKLGIKQAEDVQIFNILTIQDPFEKTTINLQAPIVINIQNKRAKQVFLNHESYTTREPLFQKSQVKEKG